MSGPAWDPVSGPAVDPASVLVSARADSCPWLRVADSSLFPDSVEINPYLTVMALADRAAEAVLDETAN